MLSTSAISTETPFEAKHHDETNVLEPSIAKDVSYMQNAFDDETLRTPAEARYRDRAPAIAFANEPGSRSLHYRSN